MKTERKVAIRRGNTVYDRLNEARERRVKALALKEPANDARPIAKAHTAHVPEDRFPPISSTEPISVTPETTRNLPLWIWAVAAACLGVLLYFVATRPEAAPTVAATPSAPSQPAQAANTLAKNSLDDTHAGQRPPILAPPIAKPASPPVQNAAAPKPRITMVKATPPVQTAQRVTASPDLFTPLTVTRAVPSPLFEPRLASPLTSLTAVRNLAISFNIPRNAGQDTVGTLISAAETVSANLGDPNIVNFTIKSTQVRFFHTADKPAATELADAIDAKLRDFTSFEPSPATGFVEIWVKSQPDARVREPAPPQQNGLIRDIRQIGTNLGNAIRALTR